ncbi:hemerythrin domain-containing protein [Actinophytocola gossypii]|uniref:Hemerythrin domain-containing protein n=1 Tax=Actinophytocola gossypii TaxID=2812003 RepID=A0ABT2JH26_9PSEU|nr:hemerythrin domain-containing protein [Actinophytocola gossypii]MCT2587173.1 hemerythrin domain-containing protein [Actinophytocola gossypii]
MSQQTPGWGDRLVAAHDALRGSVAAARAAPSANGAGLAEQLRNHCETVCVYLHGHHTTEDGALFPHLADVDPGLAPALERLRREHVVVDRILRDVDALVAAVEPERVREELDRLATELDAHFAYEEEWLVATLNALTGPVPWDPHRPERLP